MDIGNNDYDSNEIDNKMNNMECNAKKRLLEMQYVDSQESEYSPWKYQDMIQCLQQKKRKEVQTELKAFTNKAQMNNNFNNSPKNQIQPKTSQPTQNIITKAKNQNPNQNKTFILQNDASKNYPIFNMKFRGGNYRQSSHSLSLPKLNISPNQLSQILNTIEKRSCLNQSLSQRSQINVTQSKQASNQIRVNQAQKLINHKITHIINDNNKQKQQRMFFKSESIVKEQLKQMEDQNQLLKSQFFCNQNQNIMKKRDMNHIIKQNSHQQYECFETISYNKYINLKNKFKQKNMNDQYIISPNYHKVSPHCANKNDQLIQFQQIQSLIKTSRMQNSLSGEQSLGRQKQINLPIKQ